MHLGGNPDPEKKLCGKCAVPCTCQPEKMAVVSDLPIKRLTRATRKGQSKLAASKELRRQLRNLTKAAGGECSRRKKHYPRKAQTASYVEPVYGPSDGSGSRMGY